MLAIVSAASGEITVLFPNGDFDSPAGAPGAWVEAGGGTTWGYPTDGGNPNGYGTMNGAGGWGIWVGGNTTPLPIAPMGLVAGQVYTFVQDMKSIVDGDGIHPPGLKIESWGPGGKISDSGDMPATITSSWETYSFPYEIAAGATGLKVVPLWSSGGTVGYDNIGVIVPPQPVIVSIASPLDNATVSTNFTINATAVVSPGTITNVYFYDGSTLLGGDTSYPYSFDVTGASLGAHALTVVAKDSSGNSATSPVINVTVEGLAPPPLTYPTINAPTPIWPLASVNSMYNSSGTYTDRAPINWFPWGVTASRSDYIINPGGRVVKSYLGLNYAGVEFNPSYAPTTSYNASGMTTLHVDVWTTANQLAVQLQSVNGINGNVGAIVSFFADGGVITSNQWVSLDIPLSWFTSTNALLDLTHVDQLLWLDNAGYPGEPGVLLGDFYFDNVYFYNNTPLIQSPAINGTNFTFKVASQVGINYVAQGSPQLVPTAWTGLKTNAGTGGLLEFSIPITPGNPQRFFRVGAQ